MGYLKEDFIRFYFRHVMKISTPGVGSILIPELLFEQTNQKMKMRFMRRCRLK
jgi:hypothetical protein